MKIPETIALTGRTWRVELDSDYCKHTKNMGVCQNTQNTIRLAYVANGERIPQQEVEQTFFHELVHACLYTMGNTKLNENEKFVDLFAALLHQALAPHMKEHGE